MLTYCFPGISAQVTRVGSDGMVEMKVGSVYLSDGYWMSRSDSVIPGAPCSMTPGIVELIGDLASSFLPASLRDYLTFQELLWYTGDTGIMSGGSPMSDSRSPVVLGPDSPGLTDFLEDLRGSLDRVRVVRVPGIHDGIGRFEYHRIRRIVSSVDDGSILLVLEGCPPVKVIENNRLTGERLFLEWPGIPEKYLRYVLVGAEDLYGVDLARFPVIPQTSRIPGLLWRRARQKADEYLRGPLESVWDLTGITVRFPPGFSGRVAIDGVRADTDFYTVLWNTEVISTGLTGEKFWEGVYDMYPEGTVEMDCVSPVTGIQYHAEILV